MRSVHGAVCTYRRPNELSQMLDAIAAQTRRPDRLIVVDNDADPRIRSLVDSHPLSQAISVDVLAAADNPGPAGAFALAYQFLKPLAHEDDILVMFDDDDPPPDSSTIAALIGITEAAFVDPKVGGVGLRGGLLDRRTGVVAQSPSNPTSTTEAADHLHGGWFPCYRFSALEAVGGFDPTYFWGFEELDVGRRLTERGYELRVASALYYQVASPRLRRRFDAKLPARSWRHFYRHRNLLRVLRRDRAWVGLAATIAIRLLGKPIVNLLWNPRLALLHLRTNIEAILDALVPSVPSPKHRHHLPN